MSDQSEFPAYAVYFDYRVDILRRRNLVTATHDGIELATSERTLLVDEQDHGLTFYFPEKDVRLELLEQIDDHSTKCPWKGTATYWRRQGGSDPVAWTYADPKPEVAQIAGHIGFYQDRVTVAVGTAPFLRAGSGRKRDA